MRRAHKTRQRGVVLIAVMWGVFLLTALAFALSTTVRGGGEELRARKEGLQAHYLARGAVYKAIPMLTAVSSDPAKPAPFVPGQRELTWTEGDTRINIDVQDESGKFDVNATPPEVLERLFMNLGLQFQQAHDLAAAIEDWRDADSDTRPGGAEDGYYSNLGEPYHPANADFRSVEELLLARGVTPELFYGGYAVSDQGEVTRRPGLVDCLTVHSHAAAVNINYAPYAVLMAIPAMDPATARLIIAGRERKPYAAVSDFVHDNPVLLSTDTMNYLSTSSSGRYSLIAAGVTPSGITSRVRAVVQVGGFQPATHRDQFGRLVNASGQPVSSEAPAVPFAILSWDDSYVR
ncbi:MAG TPA: type II secretion system protein GspK [Terriglobales bacterium]|nr:type II secretion system protein GspK [Terriglobales bacterium]